MTGAGEIATLLKNAKTVAVIGASSNPARPSNSIMTYLQRAGYRCIPVNPNETDVLGEECYAGLAQIPDNVKIDIVNVFRRPAHTPDVAAQAAARKARLGDVKALWLQSGIINDDAMRIAQTAGLLAIQDQCIAVRHRLLSPK